ncbi:acyltransferase [bacterium]|nr:acyltransferase [bacterium]NUN46086.1 acyltransferase [bacterium]
MKLSLGEAKIVLGNLICWYYSIISRFWLRLRFPMIKVGDGFRSRGGIPFFYCSLSGKMEIGKQLTLVNSTHYNYMGIIKECSIIAGKNAFLKIGDFCGFSGISIYASQYIEIGDHVMIGGNCFIWDTDFHSLRFDQRKIELEYGTSAGVSSKPIRIADGVFIGANSIILKGVSIGSKSIVGAGSIVSKDIPPEEIWAGNPARFISKLKE